FVIVSIFSVHQFIQIQTQQLYQALEQQAVFNSKYINERLNAHVEKIQLISQKSELQDEDIYAALAHLNQLLIDIKAGETEIVTFGLMDLEGMLWEAADPEIITYQGYTDWYQAVLRGVPIAFSEVGHSVALGIMRKVVVAPVYKDGQLYRVLHARVGLEKLSGLMPELKFGEKGRAFILDEHGIMVAHPSPDLLLVDGTKESEKVPAAVAVALKQAVAEKTGRIYYTFRGVDSILAYHPIPLTNWIMFTVAGGHEFYAPINNLITTLAAIISGAVFLLLFLGWYIAGKITRPLEGLSVAAGQMSQGDLSNAITVTARDETGQLARVFEQMRLSLKELIERYQLAVEGASDAIWDWDIANNYFYFPRTKQMLGYEDHELDNTIEAYNRIIHPEDLWSVEKQRALFLAGKNKSYTLQYRVKSKSGHYIWILSRGNVVRDATGKPLRAAGSHTDITAAKEAEIKLDQLAYFDQLTNLPNRFNLMRALNNLINNAQENKDYFTVLLLDLDGFKVINDTLGHPVGDLLLQKVSELILQAVSNTVNNSDSAVARFGGDEFVILLPNRKGEAALGVAKAILSALTAAISIDQYSLNISGSVGVAFYPEHGSDADTLIKNVDMAMYKAKEDGKNRYRLFSPEISAVANKKMEIQSNLVRALKNREFILHYQPIIDAVNEKPVAVEALIRWNHPQKGLIPPYDFIPIVEESGQIINITEWVINTACHDSKQWRAQGFKPITVHINLSPKQIAQDNLIDIISNALEENKLCATQFSIEITESTAVENWEQTLKTLAELKSIGVKIALDDFGVGYSSLQHLKQLPVDTLKIDRFFMFNCTADQRDQAIVKAAINIAQSLNIVAVAEGVETAEQLILLKEMGCMHVQGYYFSKPVPLPELLALLN
ncbi:EAL domain-containing protein, partial [Thermodesulfovibrionales bacterium]|nr:EAL domain-containing protein [Thermodesulfovibrionales bacterium]